MWLDSQAIVLAGQKLGESDTVVTLLTLERGLLKGVAKGARRMKSRFGGAIQPFTYGQAVLFERRATGLRSLNHFDPIHSFQRLREEFDRLSDAAVLANAARRLLPEDQPAPDAFAVLLKALRSLEAGRDRDGGVLCWALLSLLQAAGYQPRVDRCLAGRHGPRSATVSGRWLFVPHVGGAVCPSCGLDAVSGPTGPATAFAMTPGAHALLRQALRMPPALRARLSAGHAVVREVRVLLEACIAERGRRLVKRPVPDRSAVPPVNVRKPRHV
ncbi:MAG: DNA repair protein RecO [Nitrospirota bacterium]